MWFLEDNETSAERFDWFKLCLKEISLIAKPEDTFAFPSQVDDLWDDHHWKLYAELLAKFNELLQERLAVNTRMVVLVGNVLVRLEPMLRL